MNKQSVFAALLFFMAGFLIFYPTLFVGFASDDFVWLKESQAPQQFDLFDNQSFASTKGRPGTMALFFVFHKLFSADGGRFHLVMLVFHVLNALLFFVVLRHFHRSFAFSFLAALVFLVHLSNEEPLFWASCLSLIFSLFFISVARFYIYIT